EEAVLAALAAAPVPQLMRTVDGATHVVAGARVIHVFARIAGEPGVRWLERDDHARMGAAMAQLADLHRGLASVALEAEDWLTGRSARVAGGSLELLPDGTRRVLDRIAEILDTCPHQPAQWLHGDYRLGNLLWERTRVVGIVDFDETGRGAAASEVAMA